MPHNALNNRQRNTGIGRERDECVAEAVEGCHDRLATICGVRSRCGCVPSTGQSPSTRFALIRASSGRGRGGWGTSRSDATPRQAAAESPPAPAGRESDSRTPPPCPGPLFQSNGSTAFRLCLRGSSSVRSFPVAGYLFLFPLPFDFSFPLVGERIAGDGRSSSASRT